MDFEVSVRTCRCGKYKSTLLRCPARVFLQSAIRVIFLFIHFQERPSSETREERRQERESVSTEVSHDSSSAVSQFGE